MARVLIAGCGYTGTSLGLRLAAEGHTVWGLRRRPEPLPVGILPIAADLTDPQTLRELPPCLDLIFYMAGADSADEEAYRAAYVTGPARLREALEDQGQSPRRLFFTSSTAVYAQSSGEWVDEASPASAVHFSGARLLEGERLLLGGPFPATVVRLGGIYGPGRGRLIQMVRRGEATCPEGPPRYTNRIHRDDCAEILRHLMALPRPEAIYLGVDREPADRCEVLRWLATRLGAPPPRIVPSPGPESRRTRSNKRCSNARLLASGYRFRYPTFREGYGAMLEEVSS